MAFYLLNEDWLIGAPLTLRSHTVKGPPHPKSPVTTAVYLKGVMTGGDYAWPGENPSRFLLVMGGQMLPQA